MYWLTVCCAIHLPQVTQFDADAEQGNAAETNESSIVRVIELMAAVLEDSPSNRLTMMQTSGVRIAVPCYRPGVSTATHDVSLKGSVCSSSD